MSIFCFDFWYVNFKYLALLDAKYIQVNLLSTHRSVVEMGRGTLWYVSIFLFTIEQIELQAKLLNYFLGSNKSNIN